MQLNILTSNFNSGIKIISDFNYLVELARCSKCQIFLALQITNKLYGSTEDCCCIHEIDIPFKLNSDILFRMDMIDKEILEKYENYFIPEEFNWAILPDYYWDMYIGGDLICVYNSDIDNYIILDKTTNQPIEQIHMTKVLMQNDFHAYTFMNQISGLFNRLNTLYPAESFYDIQNNTAIRQAFDNKTSAGRVLCRFKNNNIDVMFYFYKGLFSLAKADTLDLDIRFDMYQTSSFMAIFKPKKKKNPIKIKSYNFSFKEVIYCMFLNIR